MSRQVLRDYQSRALDALRGHIARGRRRLLLVAPTGAGKTSIAAAMIHSASAKGSPTLFLAHREELIRQCSERLGQFEVPHGVIMANLPRLDENALVQVASVATLVRRKTPPAKLVVVDEAHHAAAGTYRKILAAAPDSVVIGLTATPWRTDNKGLGGDLFEDVVVAATPADLIAQGHLVPFDGFGFALDADLSGVKTRGGDYDEAQLAEKVDTVEIVGGIVSKWLERANGRRTVVFAVNRAHSRHIVDEFRAAGVSAEHVDGETSSEERAAILARLASGETLVVSNVGILTEGWDCPAVSCCILARPTKSVALYTQMVGRALRPAPGKLDALIHDHGGCMARHGLPDEDRDYSLSADLQKKQARGGPGIINCPACFRTVRSNVERCSCGHVFEENVQLDIRGEGTGEGRDVEEVESEILTIDEIRKVRRATMEAKGAEFKRLQIVAERKGYKPGWAAWQYKNTFGVWPRFRDGFLDDIQPATEPVLPLHRMGKLRMLRGAA